MGPVRIIAICFAVVCLASCGGGGGDSGDQTTTPIDGGSELGDNAIGGIADGATGIPTDEPIAFTFARAIDTGTATASSIFITQIGASPDVASPPDLKATFNSIYCNPGDAIPSAVGCSGTTACTITPTDPLEGLTFHALCFIGLAEAGGTEMASQTITFTTAEASDLPEGESPAEGALPVVQFAAATGSGGEATGSVSVSIELSEAAASEIAVQCAVTGGDANQADYLLTTSDAAFAVGEVETECALLIVDDGVVEGDETIVLSLSLVDPNAATIGDNATHTYTIQDNDTLVEGSISWTTSAQGKVANNWALDDMGATDALPRLLLGSARMAASSAGVIGLASTYSVAPASRAAPGCPANDNDLWTVLFTDLDQPETQTTYYYTDLCGDDEIGRAIAFSIANPANYYVAGSAFNGDDYDLLVKMVGGAEWTTTINIDGNDEAYGIAVGTDAGNDAIYVIGSSGGSGPGLSNNDAGRDIFIAKFDNAGAEVLAGWHKTIDGAGADQDQGLDIALDGSGNVYVTGFITNAQAKRNAWIRSFAADGSDRWTELMEDAELQAAMPPPHEGHAIAIDDLGDGHIYAYVAGAIRHIGRTDDDFLVAQYEYQDAARQTFWVSRFDNPANVTPSISGDDEAAGIALDNNLVGHNIYVAGFTQMSTADDDYYADYDNYDVVLMKIAPDTQPLWTRSYGGPSGGDDRGLDVAVDTSIDPIAIYLLSWEQETEVLVEPVPPILEDSFELVLRRCDANGTVSE